ncbi:hypothetical protein [Actinomadura sp. DC4]|uniref:hypothetical protein n=1 Tax=Actinomadura sp. DC4 TaxID=3055069 RepID=UPI0025B0938E|nr:hypothetical protein [Actinomadura sp. DC4]MDN3357902.1 hypothetical protein [Actinomadura sp. DC4]
MGTSLLLYAVFIPLGVLVITLIVLWTLRSAADRWLESFRKRTGVVLNAEQESRARRRVRRRNLYSGWGTGLGMLALFEGDACAHYLGLPGRYSFLLFAILWCGWLVGTNIGDIRWVRRNQEPVRVAHARSVGVADYVSPVMATLTRGLALSPLVLVGVATFLPGRGQSAGLLTLLVVSLLLAGYMVVMETVQRWLAIQPQRAGTEEELILEDALRAETLQSMAAAPAAFGVMASCAGWSLIGDRPAAAGLGSVPFVFFVVSVGSVVLLQNRLGYRFHRKIWAERDHA